MDMEVPLAKGVRDFASAIKDVAAQYKRSDIKLRVERIKFSVFAELSLNLSLI
jgi:hypothetical protein